MNTVKQVVNIYSVSRTFKVLKATKQPLERPTLAYFEIVCLNCVAELFQIVFYTDSEWRNGEEMFIERKRNLVELYSQRYILFSNF